MIQTQMLLMEILKEIQAIQKNPDLSKSISEYYALSNSEQRKLEAAKAIIARGDELKAYEKGLIFKESELQKSLADLDQKNKKLETASSDLHKTSLQQAEKEKHHNQTKLAIASAQADLAKQRTELEERELLLKKKEKEVEAHNQSVVEFERQLKARATELRKHTEGL